MIYCDKLVGYSIGSEMFNLGILTSSDSGSSGKREDTSGLFIKQLFEDKGFRVICYEIVPDDIDIIENKIISWADHGKINLIITSGGTGLGPRDIVPEATKNVVDRMVPGISEAMRQHGFQYTKLAMISRGVSGIRNNCLIINLPGSLKAVKECLEIIEDIIPHSLEVLTKTRVDEHPV
jgi:molybdenum cofactor synthesis domain-containing protein